MSRCSRAVIEVVSALLDELQSVAPDGVRLVVDGEHIAIFSDDDLYPASWIGIDASSANDLRWSIELLLGSIQDVFVRCSRGAWPPFAREPRALALPYVRLHGGILEVWFGNEDGSDRALSFTPIPLPSCTR